MSFSQKEKQNCNTFKPVERRCIPFATVTNRLGDSNGDPIYSSESTIDTLNTLEWASSEHLIEATSIWDDDIMPWSTDNPGKLKDRQDQAIVKEIRDFFKDSTLKLDSFGCDLTRNPIFRNGALTNPNESIRKLAKGKLERAMLAAQFLEADSLRIFIGREGYEDPLLIQWNQIWKLLAEGLNYATKVLGRSNPPQFLSLCTGDNKFLRGHMLVDSPAMAAALICGLERPALWKVCISDVSSISSTALLASGKRLAYFPVAFNNGKRGWMEDVYAAMRSIHVLQSIGWHGTAEVTGIPQRSEADANDKDTAIRKFITNASVSLTMAGELASRLQDNWSEDMSPSEASLISVALFGELNVEDILLKTISSNQKPVQEEAAPQEPIQEDAPKEQVLPDKEEKTQEAPEEEIAQTVVLPETQSDAPDETNQEPPQLNTRNTGKKNTKPKRRQQAKRGSQRKKHSKEG